MRGHPQRVLKVGGAATLSAVPATSRLLLRRPRLEDLDGLAAIAADPDVARYVSQDGPMSRVQTELLLRRSIHHWDEFGFGSWAIELLAAKGELVGLVGLDHPLSVPALAHEVEVGWRLAQRHWGRGLATEAGAEAVRHGFEDRGLERLLCMIDPDNVASLAVARKLGFAYWRDVDHPRWPRPVQVHLLERGAGAQAAE